MNESLDMSLSIGPWDNTSYMSQSETGSRRCLSDGTPKALSREFSYDLSLPTRHIDNNQTFCTAQRR